LPNATSVAYCSSMSELGGNDKHSGPNHYAEEVDVDVIDDV
jgi:hypothetical protein